MAKFSFHHKHEHTAGPTFYIIFTFKGCCFLDPTFFLLLHPIWQLGPKGLRCVSCIIESNCGNDLPGVDDPIMLGVFLFALEIFIFCTTTDVERSSFSNFFII